MEDQSKQPRIQKLQAPLQDSTTATFFVVVNPGFELQAQREVEEVLAGERVAVMTGGIQFDSTWGAVRRAQPELKIASRVLVRIDQFGARDFQKLYRKVSNLPWEQWLKPKVGLSVRAASHASRLRIKAGIEESVVEAFKKSFKAPPPRPLREVMCLVRVEDDICTISLDLSGDLLHKRGTHTDVGFAPLRETWAASIVERAFEIAVTDDGLKSVFANSSWQWIEPMAGTAVFLREALSRKSGSADAAKVNSGEKSVSVMREFAVDTCFKFEASDEVPKATKKASTKIKDSSVRNVDALLKGLRHALIVDKDEAQLERGRKALKGLSRDLDVRFLAAVPKLGSKAESTPDSKNEYALASPRMVFVNPPWGQRLKGRDATDTAEGQSTLMAEIETKWKPDLVSIVFPRIAGKAAKIPRGWTEHLPLDFRAGGIPVKARFFSIQR